MALRSLGLAASGQLVGAILSLAPAEATPITVGFSGTITERSASPSELDPAIQVGSSFAGSYTIDSTSAQSPEIPPFPYANSLRYPLIPAGSMSVTALSIGPGDLYLTLGFRDGTLTKLSSDAFFINTELTGWDSAEFQISNSSTLLARGTITSVVPEPSTFLFVAGGLFCLAVLYRRHAPSAPRCCNSPL